MMPVKPDPPTRALGRAIADTVARRALFVELHSRDADRLLDHIKQVEAQRDALADALRDAEDRLTKIAALANGEAPSKDEQWEWAIYKLAYPGHARKALAALERSDD